jgi:hypothetical protein
VFFPPIPAFPTKIGPIKRHILKPPLCIVLFLIVNCYVAKKKKKNTSEKCMRSCMVSAM